MDVETVILFENIRVFEAVFGNSTIREKSLFVAPLKKCVSDKHETEKNDRHGTECT